jgi:hypothetical protein
MHIFVVSNGVIAFFAAFVLVAAIIKIKKKMDAAESSTKAGEEKAAAKDPRVRLVSVDSNGGNLPGQSPDAVVWDGDKDAAKRSDINKGLF